MSAVVFVTLVLVGFVACAEFGSYAFVHPVIRRLPPDYHIRVEQGLLWTFGRVMPFGMPASLVLAIAYAGVVPGGAGPLGWLAVACLALALATTLAVNVRINVATGTWDPEHPPDNWRSIRARWELFQAIRSWLLPAGFLLVCAAEAWSG